MLPYDSRIISLADVVTKDFYFVDFVSDFWRFNPNKAQMNYFSLIERPLCEQCKQILIKN